MTYKEDLSLQIMLANKTYHQHLYKILDKIDVHHHYQVLTLLNRLGGKSTQKVLCDRLQIEKSNMTAIIDLFENKGYITREMNYRDRRGKLIVCTEKAKHIISVFNDAFGILEEEIMFDITWKEMYDFFHVLKKINQNLVGIDASKYAADDDSTGD